MLFLMVGPVFAFLLQPLMARLSRRHEFEADRFAEALEMFQSTRWARAAVLFRAIARDYPDDGPAAFFLDRADWVATQPTH